MQLKPEASKEIINLGGIEEIQYKELLILREVIGDKDVIIFRR